MRDNRPPDVFISHASKDAGDASRICRLLEERGIRCWIAPRDIEPGESFAAAVVRAIAAAPAFILVLSEHANRSQHVPREVADAVAEGKRVFPVRLQDVQPSDELRLFLKTAQWVDTWEGPGDVAMDRVAAAIRKCAAAAGRTGPVAPAPTPPVPRRLGWTLIASVAAGLCVAAATILVVQRGRSAPMRGGQPDPRHPPGRAANPDGQAGGQYKEALRYHALVIGIGDYASSGEAEWQALRTPRLDAEAFADLLEKDYGFSVRRLLDTEATRGAILSALDLLVSLTANDAVVIYYAGHGSFDEAMGEGYWIPSGARRTTGGRPAKEDWIWNSTVMRIIEASPARHVLVIADSCYSGSFFRGEALPPVASPAANRYRRAILAPSRYAIASGGMEPVPDGTGRHSVFAGHLLSCLSSAGGDYVVASDLAMAVRQRLGSSMDQSIRMGPLDVAGHAGGEFVFARRGLVADLMRGQPDDGAQSPPSGAPGGPTASGARGSPAPGERQRLLGQVLALEQGGATNAAARSLSTLLAGAADDRLVEAVSAYLSQARRAKAHDSLKDLIQTIEQRRSASSGSAETTEPEAAQPRMIACLGPAADTGGQQAGADALLYRICLRAEFGRHPDVQVIERDALEQVLQEMNLGASELADARAATTVGRLLPASFLLLGDLMKTTDGERVFLRLVDTETTRIVGAFSAERAPTNDLVEICGRLAGQIVELAVRSKPLTAPVLRVLDEGVEAGIGRFHGVNADRPFEIVRRIPVEGKQDSAYRAEVIGSAKVSEPGELVSLLTPEWSQAPESKPEGLWVREKVTP